jgi:type I restriction enzyme, S subunit
VSAELLLREFARAAEASRGLPSFRRLILAAAFAGHLTHRPAQPGETCPLGQIAEFVMGQAPPGTECNKRGEGTVFVKVGEFGPTYPRVEAWTTRPLKMARDGDVLICVVGATVGKLNLGIDCAIGRSVAAIRPRSGLDSRYLYSALMPFTLGLREGARGSAQGVIGRSDLASILIWRPPLEEQHRIVAKVDALMALIDELEAAQTERESRRDQLRAASLARLVAAGDPAPKESARFFLSHSSRMVTKPEHVHQVRQAILDLAVKGRLVTQRQTDTPARTALIETDGTRAKIAHSDRRAASGQQPLLGADLRWDVPAGWEWRGLADLVLFIDYRGRTPSKTTSGIRLVTAKNVRPGRLSPQPEEFISPEEYTRWMTRGLPKPGDVLFTTEAPMGNAAVVRDEEPFALAQRVIDLRSYGAIDPGFLALQLAAAPFQTVLDATATGLTAKGIKAAKLKRLPIAVPPLEEQGRIVAKATELMGVCDEMELHLTEVLGLRLRVSEAAIRNASLAGTEVLVDAV